MGLKLTKAPVVGSVAIPGLMAAAWLAPSPGIAASCELGSAGRLTRFGHHHRSVLDSDALLFSMGVFVC